MTKAAVAGAGALERSQRGEVTAASEQRRHNDGFRARGQPIADIEDIEASLGDEYVQVITAFDKVEALLEQQDHAAFSTFVDTELK